ncbi:MAG TPA: ATP-binding protein [Gemmatimonadota bacterium]|jgi:PAS domain S-box-containing protein
MLKRVLAGLRDRRLTRAGAVLALVPAFADPAPETLVLALLAIPLAALGWRGDSGSGRLCRALAVVAALLLFTHLLPVVGGGSDRPSDRAARIAGSLEQRLGEDAALLGAVVRGLGAEVSPANPRGAFAALARLDRERPLAGRGVKLFGPTGELVAWYGETLDAQRGATRLRLTSAPSRATLVVDANGAGVVLWSLSRDWGIALEDPWLRRSPIEALGLPPRGWLAELERRHGVRVLIDRGVSGGAPGAPVAPGVTTAPVAGPSAPLRLAGRRVGSVELLPAAAAGGSVWLRLAAACALVALALLLREVWRLVEGGVGAGAAVRRGGLAAWLLALAGKSLVLVVARWLISAGDLLRALLPGSLSSPLLFASRVLGPFASSPADLLVTALFACVLALDAFRTVPRPAGAAAGSSAPEGGALRRVTAPAPVVVTLLLIAAGILADRRLLHAGAILIRDTSTQLLFRPYLYSTPEGAFLFAALAAAAAAIVVSAATLVVLAARADRSGAGAALAARLWPWACGLAVLVSVAAAVYLLRAAASASGPLLAAALWSSLMAGGLGLAGLSLEPALAVRGWTRSILAPAVVAGVLAGLAATTAHGGGRVWALRQYMEARLVEVGSSSSQWLEYNLELTGERLTGGSTTLEDLGAGREAAAFAAWTRTPLRDLPFPSALVVVDESGAIESRFSLLPPRDLDLLPRIARAALRVPLGAVTRVQTETDRTLLFTTAPLRSPDGEARYAVALVAESLEPALGEESAGYFLRDVFFSGETDPYLFAVHRGEAAPAPEPSLTLASGAGDDRLWMSLPLAPYLPDVLDDLSLCLTTLGAALALLVLYHALLGSSPVPWPGSWRNPLASFRGRVFSVLLAFVAVPVAVYSWISFHTTRHQIETATRALAEESLRTAMAYLGPRLEAGGEAELEAILPEAARVVGQDLIVFVGGEVAGSNRPEIFQANLFSRRMPGDLYRRLRYGNERLATERSAVGRRDVLIAYLRTPWSEGGAPYILASPLLLRDDHISRDMRDLLQVLFVLFALSLLALGLFSWLVSRQLSSPLAALKEGSDRIATGELAYRLRDPDRSDEFGRLFSAFNTMAAGLQVSRGELLAEKERIQAILSSTGAGVVALDSEGRLQLANDAARDLLSLTPDAIGKRAPDLAPAEFWRRVARALRLAQRREDEVRLPGPQGGRILHLAFAPLHGEGGERRGLVIVFEDISDVLASQRALAWEEMARQVAHELKNPLTPIKLSLQHLRRLQSEPPPDFAAVLQRNLDLVLAEIGRLERIAGEFSRFGAVSGAPEPLEPAGTLREVVDLYAQQGGGLRYELEVRGRPAAVMAEADGLKKVLVNLFENAREAMDGGSPGRETVRVELDYDAAPGRVLVRVRDSGPGIPADDLPRLFQPYFSTKTRGTGLGLAIARRIVESWGGTIEARNWEQGAEVLLWLGKSPDPA